MNTQFSSCLFGPRVRAVSGRKRGSGLYETTLQEHIGRPTDEVYAYLADLARHAEWAAGLVTIERTTPGPAARPLTEQR